MILKFNKCFKLVTFILLVIQKYLCRNINTALEYCILRKIMNIITIKELLQINRVVLEIVVLEPSHLTVRIDCPEALIECFLQS